MAKVVIASLNRKPRTGRHALKVVVKRVRDPEGQLKTVRTLDADSQSFGEDLRFVFGKNVAKARRDNKKATGVTDLVPAKN
ncbi:hypothetical protein [Caulobacter sp. 17J65-9]|uniref:hypothetical protein n=1 Tax=Caulobacter sp. 17J65-9 TaxID=2709382 RepID=UPI0013C60A9A|nr:hypothetical protein [Caulobacter sp. 17J65-9]NEX94130.1 hypothetical protein [Caulobacter sp. 17J65-9]